MPRPILDDISVVIPTLGRSILRDSICYLLEGSAWPAEVIVVDQGRVDSIASWMGGQSAPGMKLSYVPSSTNGRSAGLNQGLQRVRTPFVAITDDDCFVHENWMANLASHLRANSRTVVTGLVISSIDTAEVRRQITRQPLIVYERPRLKHDRLTGGNMGLSMSTLRQVGAFDEDPRVHFAEDCEWAYRALRSGISIGFASDVVVLHYPWRNDAQRDAQVRNYARSHGVFYGKYLRQGDLFILMRILVHHARALRWWVRSLFGGDPDDRNVGRAYLTGLLPGIFTGLRSGASR